MNERLLNIGPCSAVLASPCVVPDGSDWGAGNVSRGCGKSLVPVAATRVRLDVVRPRLQLSCRRNGWDGRFLE